MLQLWGACSEWTVSLKQRSTSEWWPLSPPRSDLHANTSWSALHFLHTRQFFMSPFFFFFFLMCEPSSETDVTSEVLLTQDKLWTILCQQSWEKFGCPHQLQAKFKSRQVKFLDQFRKMWLPINKDFPLPFFSILAQHQSVLCVIPALQMTTLDLIEDILTGAQVWQFDTGVPNP